jgi:hypothetical protein
MSLVAYLDETGHPSLDAIDPDFPVFALSMLVFHAEAYWSHVVPAVYALKFDQWGHEGVILHSRDIRKGEGAFAFLAGPANRQRFYESLNRIICAGAFEVVAVAVRKDAHKALHAKRARDPYDLALRLALERLLVLLEDIGQSTVQVIAESRGRAEDDRLRACVHRLIRRGTSAIPAERFQRVHFELQFLSKMMNVVGTQLADLVAYPVARHVLRPDAPNPAFDVLEPKLCRRAGERIGLTIYP